MVRFQTDLRVCSQACLRADNHQWRARATMVKDAALACGGLAGSLDACASFRDPANAFPACSVRARAHAAARIAPATQHSARCSAISSRPIPRRHRSSLGKPAGSNGRALRTIRRRRLQRHSHSPGSACRRLILSISRRRSHGFVTYGTDSGHESKPASRRRSCAQRRGLREFRVPFVQKVRDAAVALMGAPMASRRRKSISWII